MSLRQANSSTEAGATDQVWTRARSAADIPLWEWVRQRDSQGGAAGLATTEHGAMEALAKAMIAAGCPSSGVVARVKLIRPAHREATYLRGFPAWRARYDGTAIQWR